MKYGKWNDMEILFPNRTQRPRNQAKHFLNIKLKFMNLMKYIINKNGPILFPADVPHETFRPAMGEILGEGYCVFWFGSEAQRFECFTTPEPTETPNDYVIIENFLNG